MKIRKVLIVYKKSSYATHVIDRQDSNYMRLLKEKNFAIRRSRSTHTRHMETLESVKKELQQLGISFEVILRYHLKPIRNYDLAITIGGDGTFLETSHLLENGLLMGVNSVPDESVGYYCRTHAKNFHRKFTALMEGSALIQPLHRLQVTVDEDTVLPLVLNDMLLSNINPAGTTRYVLKVGDVTEEQKSSGLWISPAPGSTAATHSAGGKVLHIGSKKFQYVVREPYQPPGKCYQLLGEVLKEKDKIEILSMMDDASLYIDGPHFTHPIRRGSLVQVKNARKPIMAVW